MSGNKQVMRICSVCATEKPLSAFLYLDDTPGSHYGYICSVCRAREKADKTLPPNDDEGTSTVPSGVRIGTKEKVYSAREQKKQIKNIRELFKEEIQKRDELAKKKTIDSELKIKGSKEHRQFYIEGEKPTKQSQPPFARINETTIPPGSRTTHETEQSMESVKQEDIIRQESQMTSLNFSTPTAEPQTHQLKYQSDVFLKFKSWLGNTSPIVKTLDSLYGKKDTPAPPSTKPQVPGEKKKELDNGKAVIDEYIKQRFDSPGSSRKR